MLNKLRSNWAQHTDIITACSPTAGCRTFTVLPPLSSLWCPDVCNSTDLPEFEIISLLEEQLPVYRLRADTVYGYDQDDWLHTPLVAPDTRFDLTTEQIEETLKYFCKSCLQLSPHTALTQSESCSRWHVQEPFFSSLISNADSGSEVER